MKAKFALITFSFLLIFPFFPQKVFGANALDVVISEIGWSGTSANSSDEWMELYNNTSNSIDLSGWALYESGCTSPLQNLTGTILGHEYYLIERTDDNTISDILASQTPSAWGCSGLKNTGESLQLKDNNGNIIDTANSDGGSWPFGTDGSGTPTYASMERVNLAASDSDSNWITNDGVTKNGLDVGGNVINGTPKAQNSQGFVPTSAPTPTLTPTPTSAATVTPIKTPTPTSTPTKTPTPIKTPTPTKSPTPTPSRTSTPTLKPSAPLTLGLTEDSSSSPILGESTQSALIISPTQAMSKKNVLVSNKNKSANSNFQKILMFLGIIVFIAACGIVAFRVFKGRLNKDEQG